MWMPIANSADGTGDKKIVMKSIFCRISTSLRDFQDFFLGEPRGKEVWRKIFVLAGVG